jgi:ribosome assembly protein SQT1
MAHHSSHDELEDGVAGDDVDFIDESDVYAEVPVGDDHPMDDADEEDEEGHEGQDEDIGDIVWEDNSIQQFPNHHASVFAVSTHPTLPIACSGGEDDFGYLWNIETGEQIAKLTGHTDSVTSTAFSFDGDIVSTGGMDGKVRLWKKVGKDSDGKLWTFMTELVGPDEVTVRMLLFLILLVTVLS